MSGKGRFRAGAAAAVLALLLAVAGTAVAGGVNPTLLSPNHKHIAPGHIRLVVGIPLQPNKQGVFIAISPAKKLDRQGHLNSTCKRCDFVGPTHWKGNKYSSVAKYDFPGY